MKDSFDSFLVSDGERESSYIDEACARLFRKTRTNHRRSCFVLRIRNEIYRRTQNTNIRVNSSNRMGREKGGGRRGRYLQTKITSFTNTPRVLRVYLHYFSCATCAWTDWMLMYIYRLFKTDIFLSSSSFSMHSRNIREIAVACANGLLSRPSRDAFFVVTRDVPSAESQQPICDWVRNWIWTFASVCRSCEIWCWMRMQIRNR